LANVELALTCQLYARMPLGSEAADHEIVNGNLTEAESAGLRGRGAEGVANAGAIPTASAMPQRTSNAGSRAFSPLLLSVSGVYAGDGLYAGDP
jgi:hypothetical protein